MTTAPPPWHSVLLVSLLLVTFLRLAPTQESVDEVATMETFSTRIFPNLISLSALVAVRATFALVIFSVSVLQISGLVESKDNNNNNNNNNNGELMLHYLPGSKLKRNVTIRLRGIRAMTPFTLWAWNLLGCSFALNAWIAWCDLPDRRRQDSVPVPPWMLRCAVWMFETAAPCALLVAFVVTYGIWPQMLASKKGITTRDDKNDPTLPLKLPHVLVMHNANVVMALTEVSLLGGLPVRYGDLAVSALFGLSYVFFSWACMHHWKPEEGPHFLYFFLDTTLGITTSVALVVLLLVLMAFYGIFCVLHQVLDHLGGGPMVHSLAVVLLSWLVCRFRD